MLQECKLEAILVLRIQDGNDIFVSVAGKYLPSFFGVSLQCLSLLPRYVKQHLTHNPQDVLSWLHCRAYSLTYHLVLCMCCTLSVGPLLVPRTLKHKCKSKNYRYPIWSTT